MAKEKFVIEMGSSNTVIYKMGYGIVLREPSIVAINKYNSKEYEVGFVAKKMQGKIDDSFLIVEPISHGVITDERMAGLMLHGFLNKVCENRGSAEVTFCVSIGLSDNELLAFKNVAYANNITTVRFENVCLAGLKGANVNIAKSSAVGCINLGGGTSNFAVISLDKTTQGFSVDFGGKDIDNAIIDYFKAIKNVEFSPLVAEKIKNDCGSLYTQDTTNIEITGVDLDTKKPVTEIISAIEVREAMIEFFERIKQAMEHLLCNCSADIINDITKNGIYIIGGLANMTGLENYLTRKLNIPIYIPDEPENCTVQGVSE